MTSACADCCGDSYNNGWIDPGSAEVYVGDTVQFFAKEQDKNCYGQLLDPFDVGSSASWDSGNYAVADPAGGNVTGLSPGATTIYAFWDATDWQWDDLIEDCVSNPDSAGGVAYFYVDPPTVSLVGNNYVFVGHDISVTTHLNVQFLQYAPPGGSFSFSSSDFRDSFSSPTGSPLRTYMTAAFPSTNLLDRTISVTYTKSGASVTSSSQITARIFKFLTSTQQNVPLGPGLFGYHVRVTYDIYTSPQAQHVDPGADGIGILEDVAKTGGNTTGTPITHDGATDQNSEFGDDLGIISNAPLGPSLDGTYSQDIFVGGFRDRNNTLHYTANGVTITNNGPTI